MASSLFAVTFILTLALSHLADDLGELYVDVHFYGFIVQMVHGLHWPAFSSIPQVLCAAAFTARVMPPEAFPTYAGFIRVFAPRRMKFFPLYIWNIERGDDRTGLALIRSRPRRQPLLVLGEILPSARSGSLSAAP